MSFVDMLSVMRFIGEKSPLVTPRCEGVTHIKQELCHS
jgi:hypothetical protein